jgi:hypothetical protein
VTQGVVGALADLPDDGAHASAYVQQEQDRERQLILAEVGNLLPNILLKKLKILLLERTERLPGFFVDYLRIEHHQVRAYPDDFVRINLLCKPNRSTCQPQTSRQHA